MRSLLIDFCISSGFYCNSTTSDSRFSPVIEKAALFVRITGVFIQRKLTLPAFLRVYPSLIPRLSHLHTASNKAGPRELETRLNTLCIYVKQSDAIAILHNFLINTTINNMCHFAFFKIMCHRRCMYKQSF